MRGIIQQYYQRLCTVGSVSDDNIEAYLSHINFNHKVDQDDNEALIEPITINDLLKQTQRSPTRNSPGNNGLGYQYLKILFNILPFNSLLLEVYNHTLTEESISLSWKEIRVRILPKKRVSDRLKRLETNIFDQLPRKDFHPDSKRTIISRC